MLLELAFSLLVQAPTAHASKNSDDTQAVTESLSQLIRSNPGHYWSYVKKDTLQPFSQYQGLVAGDAHLGNFSVIPVESSGGKRSLKFVDIDFDDAGVGPFALDFARLVVTVKAVSKDIKTKDLVQAYVDGLNGKRIAAPSRIQESLSMTLNQYDALDARYVDKKTSHGKFKIEAGEVEAYSAKYSLTDITRLFAKEKVLDVATRPEDRGGSAGAVRIWVLTQSQDGVQHISEIKGFVPTSMSKFEAQEEPIPLINKVQAAFWPGLNPDSYNLTTIAGDLVWVRGKKIPLIDIPYKMKSAGDQIFVSDLALYDANLLGLVHGAQSKAYVAAINGAQDDFREGVKQLMHDYIDYAEKTLR